MMQSACTCSAATSSTQQLQEREEQMYSALQLIAVGTPVDNLPYEVSPRTKRLAPVSLLSNDVTFAASRSKKSGNCRAT